MRTEWNRVRSSQSAFNTLKGNLERKAPDDSIQDRDGDGSKSRPSMILDLPTEILTKILELVLSTQNINQVPWRLYQLSWDPTAIPALAYTCRRFSQIAVPFNFRNICIDDFRQTVIPWTERPKRLLQVLRSNPSLGSHCRDFSMRIESNPDLRERRSEGNDLEFTSQLLLSVPNVRSLSVNGGWGADESAWKLLRLCLPRLCHLERLELRTDGFEGLKVTEVIQRLQDQVPNLKGLEVHGFKQDPVPPLEGHETLEAVNLTSIRLAGYYDGPEALERLLSWPRALSKFAFASVDYSRFNINLQMFKDKLLKHRETLKVLDIGDLPEVEGVPKQRPHWNEFTALESLKLSRWMVGPDRKSTGVLQPEALDWILTPRLKKFTLDFSIPDQHQASLDEFGEVEENWVRWIAESAIKRKWALQEIRLQFEPEWWDPAEHHFSEYPWDRMDSLNKEFEPQGIVITYSDPPVTRERWAKIYVPGPA